MISYVLIISALSVSLYIFWLIRRNALYLSYSLFWFAIAIVILILGLFPQLNIKIASYLGVSYYPILPVTFAILILFVKCLKQDIELSEKERKIRRLIQELSIAKAEIQDANSSHKTLSNRSED